MFYGENSPDLMYKIQVFLAQDWRELTLIGKLLFISPNIQATYTHQYVFVLKRMTFVRFFASIHRTPRLLKMLFVSFLS